MKTHRTVSALVDFSYRPTGSGRIVHRIEQIEIPLARTRECNHHDSVCPNCTPKWQKDCLFTEQFPWSDDAPDPPRT